MLLKIFTKKATQKTEEWLESTLEYQQKKLDRCERENRQEIEDAVAEDNLQKWQIDRWRIQNTFEEDEIKLKIVRIEGWLASVREELAAKAAS